MDSTLSDRYAIRSATNDDLDEVVEVCGLALGWNSPTFDRALFEWKHLTNAFGRSLILLATDAAADHRIVAVRTFMKWRFRDRSGSTVDAARAVDTATLPEAQGNGLFRHLTETGLAQLDASGCGFVFNTPNKKSGPGYLKMGWFTAGPVQFGFRPLLRSMPKIAQARTGADKPSLDTPELGVSASEAIGESTPLPQRGSTELSTDHRLDSLRWRYAGGPLRYRVVEVDNSGSLVVRVRQRGPIRELVVADVLGTPAPSACAARLRAAQRQVEADLVIAPDGTPATKRLARVGPTLALRVLNRPVSANHFAFSPGDIEIF